MPEKRFKTVLQIGGEVGSSLKNSFSIVTGNTKKLGATIKDLKARAETLRGELKNKKLGGPEAATGVKKLENELAKLETRIKRTRKVTDSLARIKMADFGARMQRIGTSIRKGAITITAASASVGAAVVAITKNSANYGDDAKKAAERMGMGINELIKLKHAAQLSGVEGKEFESGTTNLFKSIEKARNGKGEKANIFNHLKLNPKNLVKMVPEERFKTVAEAFQNLKGRYAKEKGLLAERLTGNTKMANVLDLGRGGLAEAGKETEKLNLTISTRFAKDSETFNDNLTKIGAALQGVGNIVSEYILPVFNKFSEQLIAFASGKHGDIKKWAEDFGKYLTENVPIWMKEAKEFGQQIGSLASKAWKVIKPLGGVKVLLGAFVAIQFAPAITGIFGLGAAFLFAMPAIVGCATALVAMGISALPIIGVALLIGAAIGGIAWAILGVIKNWDWYKKTFFKVMAYCGEKLQEFGQFLSELWVGAKKTLFEVAKNIGDSIGKTFEDLKKKIGGWFDWVGSKFQWIGDSIGKVGGWFGGGSKSVLEPVIVGARAVGGPVSAGKRYLVGERGPEIFQPKTSGKIIPNSALGHTDNRTYNITINASPGMNERTLADLVLARLNGQQAALAGGALYD